jgi:hypothetical protein
VKKSTFCLRNSFASCDFSATAGAPARRSALLSSLLDEFILFVVNLFQDHSIPKQVKASRRLTWLLLLLVIPVASPVAAQQFNAVTFHQLPQDYQLYPRDANNEANVPVSGEIKEGGYQYLSFVISRENATHAYLRTPVQYDDKGVGRFSTSIKIKAELANYGLKVYAKRATDSLLIVGREKFVAGDAFVVMGQSNSTGFFQEKDTSNFCRTFGVITGTLNTEAYNASDTLWSLSNTSGKTNVGAMGLEIQKRLSEASGVPNCLINGGFHWSSAEAHAIRNPDNPQDLHTAYGRMLYRVKKSGAEKAVKAFIYRQGESEAYHEGGAWDVYFDKLYQNVKKDIPAIKKTYVFQIDIIYYPSFTGAELREYQRNLPNRYPDVRTLATVGTQQFDGLHYGREGNKQGGFEVSRLISRDFYGLTDTLNIDSPNLKKAFFKTPEKNELVLVFDDFQDLVYPEPIHPNANLTLTLEQFFQMDGWGSVKSGKAENNRVYLTLNQPAQVTELSYLPPYLQEGGDYYPFNGPFIKNVKGMRAFTFYKVPVTLPLGTPVLTGTAEGGRIQLEWTAVSGAEQYHLERRIGPARKWISIAKLPSTRTQFTDTANQTGVGYSYRLSAVSKDSESGDYGRFDTDIALVTGIATKGVQWKVYPNPSNNATPLRIELPELFAGTFSLFDQRGHCLKEEKYADGVKLIVVSEPLPAGTYFVQFRSIDKQFSQKVVVSP